jgi:hypothetical protein
MTLLARPATIGAKGFDCNTPVSSAHAELFKRAGFSFALRYLPRVAIRPGDLSPFEFRTLVGAGLAVMPVQHVESAESWEPSLEKGQLYGSTAARFADAIGFPKGVSVWCDLEGVSLGISKTLVIDYCRAWYEEVIRAGYLPGLYVGWHSRLTPDELYALPFPRYWGAYNENVDDQPSVRGWCMKQHEAKGDYAAPHGIPFEIDTNTIMADRFSGLPFWAIEQPELPG